MALAFVLAPALGACSSFSSSYQAASGAPAHDPRDDIYPKQSLVDLFRSEPAPAPPQTASVPQPPNTYAPADRPYVPASAAIAARPNSDSPASLLPYPQQSLSDLFWHDAAQAGERREGTPAATNVPHPPSTYTPAD